MRVGIRHPDRPPQAFFERPMWMQAWFPGYAVEVIALCQRLNGILEPDGKPAQFPEELTAVSRLMAKARGTLHPSDSRCTHHVAVSFSALEVCSAGFPLPKPPEGHRKILREVEGTDDSLIRLLPNRGVCILR